MQAEDQVGVAADGLRALVRRFGVPLFSRESSSGILVDATTAHIQSAEKSELLLAAEVEKRAALSHELETAKGEIQALQDRSPVSPITVKSTGTFYNCLTQSSRPTSRYIAAEQWPTSGLDFVKDVTGFVAIFQPPWLTLPSPKARAARLSGVTWTLLP